MTGKQKKVLYRIIISAALLLGLHMVYTFITDVELLNVWYVKAALYAVPYVVIGYDILRKAFLGLIRGAAFDENFLMAVATIGAIALGEYAEGVAVMLFYQIGELFQSVAVGKSRRNITALMDIRPDYANIEGDDGELKQVDPDEVSIGTVIVVRPGEKIPIDGTVVEGRSTLNTGALTGESVPRDISEGEAVISGCINNEGLLKIRTDKEFGESTVSKILDLVENSSMKKSKSENFISKFAKYYTPAVVFGAMALAIIPPILTIIFSGVAEGGLWDVWSGWIIRALTFLVISCPCALVISIPLSFFGGIGAASASGILVKGSNYLEAMAETKYIVFDKTGTLTEGVFKVTKICPAGDMTEEKLLEYARAAESFSTHPISKSLMEAGDTIVDKTLVKDVEEIGGHGVKAMVEGHRVACGNAKLMKSMGLSYDEDTPVGTLVYVAVDDEYAGYIVISDVIKKDAAFAVRELKASGIEKTVMLTGDSERVAGYVAKELSLDEYHSELLPGDKVCEVEKLLKAKKPKEKLAFVGDGINDAPVLSRADIGIAMGALGSDAAIEAADIVLMDDNPAKIALAMRIARKCLRIVYENIVFALGVKGICLVLGALGIAGMWVAIFADVGVMVLAVLNAIRCLHIKQLI